MEKIQDLKNRLIDRIILSKDEKLLSAIEDILAATQKEEEVELSSEQIEMLQMSEQDIRNNRLISEEDLRAKDEEWILGNSSITSC